ncbi:MAG: hypothetical protein H6741_17895 [Alphaproteobacteria bacterium]|nr:hypothetical protein [Alphaproteobacteria bacterium]
MRGPTRLRSRLVLAVCGATLLGSLAFGAAAYALLRMEELAEAEVEQESALEIDADIRRAVLLALTLAAPVGAAVGGLGALLLVGRALRPVDTLVAEAQAMRPERLDERLSPPEGAEELEGLVRALNAHLERVERASEAHVRFSADVSHELRTPLAVLASHLEIALRRPRSEEIWRSTAETALSETRRLTRMTEALLALAQASGGDARGLSPLDLGALAQASLETPEVSRAVQLRLPEQPVLVQGDADALGAALASLLRNAIRYAPAEAPIRVSVSGDAEHARLDVDDGGPGFDLAELPRLLRPFERGRDVGELPGEGLGLSLVERVAARHGGRLELGASELGGARARLVLPRA